ncbi:hypothetical protein, partial [Tropicimonas sp. IMCC6043]|uniref:hypothetical protein n=1 Tax=Tropicimonas sp. IMCC6043 TaxID=2510645 RepID=UPI00101D4229
MTRTTSVSSKRDIDTMTEAMPQRLEGVATTSKERNQMTEQTNRYNAALDLARAVIMGDGKRAEAVGALVEQHGLTE